MLIGFHSWRGMVVSGFFFIDGMQHSTVRATDCHVSAAPAGFIFLLPLLSRFAARSPHLLDGFGHTGLLGWFSLGSSWRLPQSRRYHLQCNTINLIQLICF